jgi:hypothetical protein
MTQLIVDWPGESGKTYRYYALASVTTAGIKAGPGNYAFVKQLPNGNFTPLYFGQAEDLQARLPCHERLDEARRAGVTHVMAHTQSGGEQVRLAEEYDLIRHWNTALNTHHRRVS